MSDQPEVPQNPPQTDAPRQFTLTREIIHVAAVEAALLPKKIGYVKLKQFQERTEAELVQALEKLDADAGGHVDGLVLDLRGNPGGLLDEAVKVADLFVSQGVIVTTVGRRGRKLEEDVASRGWVCPRKTDASTS